MVIQKNINLYDLFYDPSDKLNFAMIECIDNLTDSIASTMMRYIEISKTIESTFYKSYTGICKAHILGYDDIYQSALLTYYIKILKWPQHNWIYCEGPIQYDWTKCINGYTLDYLTKRWITKEAYIDRWIIIGFTIFVWLATVITNYDSVISVLLLENISIYFVLFIVENKYTVVLNFYFEDLISVVTNLSSLLFPLYRIMDITFYGQLSCSFSLNWLSMLLFISVFIILKKIL